MENLSQPDPTEFNKMAQVTESPKVFPFEVGGSENELGLDDSEYIFDRMHVRAILILIYTIVFCLCFFGNLVVLIVVILHWRMRSITKFCLANLAFADFCVGIFCIYQNLSVYLIHSWILGEFLCKMYQYISNLSHTTSILILMVICVERYLVVRRPFLSKKILTKRRLKIIVAAVWIMSGVYCSPRLYYVRTIVVPRSSFDVPGGSGSTSDAGSFDPFQVQMTNQNQNLSSSIDEDQYEYDELMEDEMNYDIICVPQRTLFNSRVFDMINSILLFLIPLIVMSILYSKICITLWKRSEDHHRGNQNECPLGHESDPQNLSPQWNNNTDTKITVNTGSDGPGTGNNDSLKRNPMNTTLVVKHRSRSTSSSSSYNSACSNSSSSSKNKMRKDSIQMNLKITDAITDRDYNGNSDEGNGIGNGNNGNKTTTDEIKIDQNYLHRPIQIKSNLSRKKQSTIKRVVNSNSNSNSSLSISHHHQHVSLDRMYQMTKIRSKKVHFKDFNSSSTSRIKRCGAFRLKSKKKLKSKSRLSLDDGQAQLHPYWPEHCSSTSRSHSSHSHSHSSISSSCQSQATSKSSASDSNVRILIKPIKGKKHIKSTNQFRNTTEVNSENYNQNQNLTSLNSNSNPITPNAAALALGSDVGDVNLTAKTIIFSKNQIQRQKYKCCTMNLNLNALSWNHLRRQYFLSRIRSASSSNTNPRTSSQASCFPPRSNLTTNNNCGISKKLKNLNRGSRSGSDSINLRTHYVACSRESIRERQTVIRMLCLIVIVFAICNLPFHVRKITVYWWPNFNYSSQSNVLFIPITQLMMYTNCALNPIIYFFMSRSFRACLNDLWRRFQVRCVCHKRNDWSNSGSSNNAP